MNINPRDTGRKRLIWLLGAAAALALVVVFLMLVEPRRTGADETAMPPDQRQVTVVQTRAADHAAEITGFAEVKPRWSSTLRVQVSGELVQVSDAFQPATAVAAGQVLAVVDSTAWLANLAEAEIRLAGAELQLMRALQEADEARRSWQEAGLDGEPASRLVLHEPQADAARVERDAALAARDWAARQVAQTRIRAPFDGIITARTVSRGEAVMAGDAVGELFATDAFELAVPVSVEQWRALPGSPVGAAAELVAQDGTNSWTAQVARLGATIDPASRMRTLHLVVDRPLSARPPLLPGTFVQVRLGGREVRGLLEIPEGAMTRQGQVWYVDSDDRLAVFDADVLFTRPGRLYVREPMPAAGWRVVRYPLASYMVGQAVRPVLRNEES